MRMLQAQATVLLRSTSHVRKSSMSFRQRAGQTLRRVLNRFAVAFDRRAQAEAAIVDRYICCSWNDSIERQLVDDIEKIGL